MGRNAYRHKKITNTSQHTKKLNLLDLIFYEFLFSISFYSNKNNIGISPYWCWGFKINIVYLDNPTQLGQHIMQMHMWKSIWSYMRQTEMRV